MRVASRILLCILIVHRDTEAEPLSGFVDHANPNEFPFVVSIARRFDVPANNPFGHTCGGALIKNRYILTSARCFLPGKSTSDYFVYAGSVDLARCDKYEIKAWTSYDDWFKRRYRQHVGQASLFADNDIAVVELFDKVRCRARIAKVWNIPPVDLVGREVFTAGWGLLFDDTSPRHLLKASLRVIDDNECKAKIRRQSNDASYDHETNLLCTRAVALFATLDDGDRGSPVFVRHANGDYRVVGVNLRCLPLVDDVCEKDNQRNLHVAVQPYVDFFKSVPILTYLSQ